jgi:DNA mismatch repair protein MutL
VSALTFPLTLPPTLPLQAAAAALGAAPPSAFVATATLVAAAPELQRLGLTVERFGRGAVAVREVPAILGQVDARRLILDVLDELSDLGDSGLVQARIDAVLSRMSCHGSIRSGRQMRAEEMNALLREMEATPHSGQCNHGRPTYVELKLADIERLFGRT